MFYRPFLLFILLSSLQFIAQAQTFKLSQPWDSEHFEHYSPDINGDGVPDTFLHAKQKDNKSLYILSSKISDEKKGIALPQYVATSNIDGIPWSAGESKLVFGDFNGDKRDDVLVMLWAAQQAYVVYTSSNNRIDLSDINRSYDSALLEWFNGSDDYEYHVGDFDGSGTDDVLVLAQNSATM